MVYMLLGTGFEETEAIAPLDLLRRADVPVLTVGVNGKIVYGGHGIGIEADILLSEMDLTNLDMIILPGGLGGVASIRGCQKAMDAIRTAYAREKYIAAICAGPTILAELGITDGRQAVCYPGCEEEMGSAHILAHTPCIRDGRVITAASAGCATAFALELIAALKGQNEARRIASQIVIR